MSMKYLKIFFEEKNLPLKDFEKVSPDGTTHFLSNEVVIEHVMIASLNEQKVIADVIKKIDFANGDVNHFLDHLAQGIVDNY